MPISFTFWSQYGHRFFVTVGNIGEVEEMAKQLINKPNLKGLFELLNYMQSIKSNNIDQGANNKKLMTIEEVAIQLSVSKTTIYRLVESRKIQFYKIGGGLRFRQEDIDQFMEESSFKPIK